MSIQQSIEVRQLGVDDIPLIESGTRSELWGEDNEMTQYTADDLKEFFSHSGNIMFGAIDNQILASVAVAYIHIHPSRDDNELYVHEIDTRPDYRHQGLAKEVMKRK